MPGRGQTLLQDFLWLWPHVITRQSSICSDFPSLSQLQGQSVVGWSEVQSLLTLPDGGIQWNIFRTSVIMFNQNHHLAIQHGEAIDHEGFDDLRVKLVIFHHQLLNHIDEVCEKVQLFG